MTSFWIYRNVLGATKKFLDTQAEMHTDWMNEMHASCEARMNVESHLVLMPQVAKIPEYKGMSQNLLLWNG